ncbi:MAG: hypothetical protein IH631_05960 [Candidatus Thorarchaeota archaeon]|nr:hypothetical protein [Candidatus Thorarchaeota archaeon]
MTLEIINLEPKLAMLLQTDLWEDIYTFLHLLFDPVLIAFQDEALRRTLLSTVIWSLLVICGLVFAVYEFPSIINFIMGTQAKPVRVQTKTAAALKPRTASETSAASRHQLSLDKSQQERDRRETAVRKTGVTVAAKLVQERELLRLSVSITNGSTSHIDMVVVDLNLPSGIDAETGSFRMQRLGTINAGESKSVDFIFRPTGGNPADIGGDVEFLGASYEVSKIPLPVPEMEGMEYE